ncbi:MAG: sulfate reduction electron transfer complex DsrMKJOP subunit DsrP [Candidatus Zixiibacteriota bacterium]
MLEKALIGDKKYWAWIGFLIIVIFTGFMFFMRQLSEGLTVTGLSRDVPWGLYIAQLTFLVGVAASAVMVVLPYYLHNYKKFGKLVILGEFLAIPSVIMCMLFVFVDMGQPFRVTNVFLNPTPNSPMFWDSVVLSLYMLLNILIGGVTLGAEKKGIAPPKWIKPFIYISIPVAVSIHTVTAFLYSGLSARAFWMTAIMAPRFLASAFAAGPSLLLLLVFIVRKFSKFSPDKEAIQKLAQIITYAMCLNVFFILMEVFTTAYSAIPEHMNHMKFMYFGLDGNTTLVPWMWTSSILAIFSLILLINPKTRKKENILAIACIMVFVSLWIEKGFALITTGFTPTPFDTVTPYSPTTTEVFITLGIYALGFLIVTLLYKVVIGVRNQRLTDEEETTRAEAHAIT